MTEKIQCATHGECDQAFVCIHLLGETAGLGFNRNEPTNDDPFPDSWCDNCEIIRSSAGGWNADSEKLTHITLICSGCYERARIRHTRPEVTLDDLAGLRWKCGACDDWHSGPALDFCYDSPDYWRKEDAEIDRKNRLRSGWKEASGPTFLTEGFCAIEDRDFFVRGTIALPIIGAAETFRWGVWGSLSRDNFTRLSEMDEDPECVHLGEMFSWLSNQISEYPDTLNLKMYVRSRDVGLRPDFRLELTDHPLSQEYHKGISPERVKKIMSGRLANNT